jgi:hypothetical protein
VVEEEIAGEVTDIRNNMQEFVNKQLPGWIQEEVVSELSLPPTIHSNHRTNLRGC